MRKAVFTGTAEELNKYANDPKIKINMQMMQMLNKNQNVPERRNILRRKWSLVVLRFDFEFPAKKHFRFASRDGGSTRPQPGATSGVIDTRFASDNKNTKYKNNIHTIYIQNTQLHLGVLS